MHFEIESAASLTIDAEYGRVWYRARNLIPTYGVTLFHGPPGAGKTASITVDVAQRIAREWPIGPCEIVGPDADDYDRWRTLVVVLAGEDPGGLRLRYAAWEKLHQVEGADNLLVVSSSIDLFNLAQMKELSAELSEWAEAIGSHCSWEYCIIVDPLVSFLDGRDENAAHVMAGAYRGLRELRRQLMDATIIVCAHGDADRPRGSRQQLAEVDGAFSITDKRGYFELKQTKVRNFVAPPLRWRKHLVRIGKADEKIIVAVPEAAPGTAATTQPRKKNTTRAPLITEILRRLGGDTKPVALEVWRNEAVSAGVCADDRRAFWRARKRAENAGEIVVTDDKAMLCDRHQSVVKVSSSATTKAA